MKHVVSLIVALTVTALARSVGAQDPCTVDPNGATVTLPPVGCSYLSPTQVHMIMSSLPPGTQINLDPIHEDFICGKHRDGCPVPTNGAPTTEVSKSTLSFHLTGTGAASSLDCTITFSRIPMTTLTDARPDVTAPSQTFNTEIKNLDTMQPGVNLTDGCNLFSHLRARAGSMSSGAALPPSLGTTTLTKQVNGKWEVASCFDVNYELEWTIKNGIPFVGGLSGVQDGTAHMCAQADDDGGFLPPTVAARKCEDRVGKAVGKLATAIYKCHIARALGKLADDTAEDVCETTAKTKFATTDTTGCGACTNLAAIAATVEAVIDGTNDKIYCAGSTQWGGDDLGFIPPDKVTAMCEDGIANAVAKFIGAIVVCHIKAADRGYANVGFAEEACENLAAAKFVATKTTGCPGCVNLPMLARSTHAFVDGFNGTVYCASPSGAFLDDSSVF